MGNSIFLAKLLGPVMVAVGLGAFANAPVYRGLIDEFLRSRALIYLSGILAMAAGLAIVLVHNIWVANWPVLITIIGWLGLAGGAFRIVVPQGTEKIGRRMLKSRLAFTIGGAVWLVTGLILCIVGYSR